MTYIITRKNQTLATGPYTPAQIKQMQDAGYDVKEKKEATHE